MLATQGDHILQYVSLGEIAPPALDMSCITTGNTTILIN